MPGQRAANIIQVNLRITAELHKRLQKAAKRAGRSLNQEMMLRLEQSFRRGEPMPLGPGQAKELIDFMRVTLGQKNEKKWRLKG